MITEIKIQNFKLFKSLHLKDLPQILIIGGKNNSGKTSVLEAVALCQAFGSAMIFLKFINWRGETPSLNNDMWLLSAFHNLEGKHPLEFEFKDTSNLSKQQKVCFEPLNSFDNSISGGGIRQRGLSFSEKGAMGYSVSYWPDITRKRETSQMIIEDNKIKPKNLSSSFERIIMNQKSRSCYYISSSYPLTQEENAVRYSKLELENNTSGVLSALKILEPKLKSLHILSPQEKPIIYGDTGARKKTPLFLMGQGISRLISILLVIAEAKNGIVLLDEMEVGFHFSFMKDLWKAVSHHAKINNTQIIATTHSRELIAGAVEGIPEQLKTHLQYRRIEKGEGSDFKSVSYDLDSLRVTLDADLAIR